MDKQDKRDNSTNPLGLLTRALKGPGKSKMNDPSLVRLLLSSGTNQEAWERLMGGSDAAGMLSPSSLTQSQEWIMVTVVGSGGKRSAESAASGSSSISGSSSRRKLVEVTDPPVVAAVAVAIASQTVQPSTGQCPVGSDRASPSCIHGCFARFGRSPRALLTLSLSNAFCPGDPAGLGALVVLGSSSSMLSKQNFMVAASFTLSASAARGRAPAPSISVLRAAQAASVTGGGELQQPSPPMPQAADLAAAQHNKRVLDCLASAWLHLVKHLADFPGGCGGMQRRAAAFWATADTTCLQIPPGV